MVTLTRYFLIIGLAVGSMAASCNVYNYIPIEREDGTSSDLCNTMARFGVLSHPSCQDPAYVVAPPGVVAQASPACGAGLRDDYCVQIGHLAYLELVPDIHDEKIASGLMVDHVALFKSQCFEHPDMESNFAGTHFSKRYRLICIYRDTLAKRVTEIQPWFERVTNKCFVRYYYSIVHGIAIRYKAKTTAPTDNSKAGLLAVTTGVADILFKPNTADRDEIVGQRIEMTAPEGVSCQVMPTPQRKQMCVHVRPPVETSWVTHTVFYTGEFLFFNVLVCLICLRVRKGWVIALLHLTASLLLIMAAVAEKHEAYDMCNLADLESMAVIKENSIVVLPLDTQKGPTRICQVVESFRLEYLYDTVAATSARTPESSPLLDLETTAQYKLQHKASLTASSAKVLQAHPLGAGFGDLSYDLSPLAGALPPVPASFCTSLGSRDLFSPYNIVRCSDEVLVEGCQISPTHQHQLTCKTRRESLLMNRTELRMRYDEIDTSTPVFWNSSRFAIHPESANQLLSKGLISGGGERLFYFYNTTLTKYIDEVLLGKPRLQWLELSACDIPYQLVNSSHVGGYLVRYLVGTSDDLTPCYGFVENNTCSGQHQWPLEEYMRMVCICEPGEHGCSGESTPYLTYSRFFVSRFKDMIHADHIFKHSTKMSKLDLWISLWHCLLSLTTLITVVYMERRRRVVPRAVNRIYIPMNRLTSTDSAYGTGSPKASEVVAFQMGGQHHLIARKE